MRTAPVVALLVLFAAIQCGAQSIGEHARSIALDVLKDPTTYAPAVASEVGKTLDWSSSQRFFAAGYLEVNPYYTVSGRPYDRPVSAATGHQINMEASLQVLGFSVANNAIVGVASRALTARWPEHRRLIQVASVVERVAFAFGTAYVNSAHNFRQWRRNVNMPLPASLGPAW